MDREPARDRDVVIFDVETTGTDRSSDQVIELGVQFGLDGPAGPGVGQVWRIRPSCPIHPGAQAVHGISMEDLEGCPSFGDVARDIREVIDGARVLIGYNLAFDIEMLQAELARVGLPPIDFTGKQLVDPLRLWQRCEPRSLQAAHRRFVGQEFAAAHSASADVAATGRVLRGMLSHFNLGGDWAEIAQVCEPRQPGPPLPIHPEVDAPERVYRPEANDPISISSGDVTSMAIDGLGRL
jgi:DNA polymerase-3 subunit epsilon